MSQIPLGSRVRDSYTGFTGMAISRTENLNGPVRICIEGPLDRDGKVQPPQWFDEPRVEVIAEDKPKVGFDRP